jgi:putative hemolysin
MDMMPASDINDRDAIRVLPPLIKGYLRVGCYIGDGAVVDEEFGTTDVFIIASTARIPEKYFS